MKKSAKYRGTLLFFILFLAGSLGTAGNVSALDVGERAPDFTLPATTGENISLSDFRGKKLVLLEFYQNDFGPT